MNQVIVHEPMDVAALNQLVRAATSCPAHIMDQPRRLWAIAAVVLTPPRQFAANRARRAAQKLPDHPLTAATNMFGEYHATFLAAEVLASSVHRNILCPTGRGCCTCNLSLRISVIATHFKIDEARAKGILDAAVAAACENDVARLMNQRPRKTLGWKTPEEAMAEELAACKSTVALET